MSPSFCSTFSTQDIYWKKVSNSSCIKTYRPRGVTRIPRACVRKKLSGPLQFFLRLFFFSNFCLVRHIQSIWFMWKFVNTTFGALLSHICPRITRHPFSFKFRTFVFTKATFLPLVPWWSACLKLNETTTSERIPSGPGPVYLAHFAHSWLCRCIGLKILVVCFYKYNPG